MINWAPILNEAEVYRSKLVCDLSHFTEIADQTFVIRTTDKLQDLAEIAYRRKLFWWRLISSITLCIP